MSKCCFSFFLFSTLLVIMDFYRELPMEHQRRIIGYQDLDAPQYDFDTAIFS